MVVVDTHTHVLTNWFEPVETLLYHMDANQVDQAALIQDAPQTNNTYLFDCVRRYPGRFAPVVIVDVESSDGVAQLEQEAARGASGVRLRPTVRSAGADPLAVWRAAARLGLSISCSGRLPQFVDESFTEVLLAIGDTPLVIEHLGSGQLANNDATSNELRRDAYSRLARFPNIAIKFHGLGEFSHRALPPAEPFPFVRPILPALEIALESFGPARMMWGSDFPLVCAREGYRNALVLAREQFSPLATNAVSELFGGTAARIFQVR
jgi:L-fuconolactonase